MVPIHCQFASGPLCGAGEMIVFVVELREAYRGIKCVGTRRREKGWMYTYKLRLQTREIKDI